MGYRLLLDENVDREVGARLAALGHDVERVADVDELGTGTPDEALARYSADDERSILTHDDDFVTTAHGAHAVLFVADESMPAEAVAAVVDRMADAYPCEQIEGVQQVGREWLEGDSVKLFEIDSIGRERTAASPSVTNVRRAHSRAVRRAAARTVPIRDAEVGGLRSEGDAGWRSAVVWKRAICRPTVRCDVRSEERTTRASGDAHTAAAEAFADRATDRFGEALTELSVFGSTVRGETRGLASDVDVLVVLADDADHAAVDDALHDLAYDVMLAYGPVVELHVLTESAFEEARDGNLFLRRAVSEGQSYA